MIVEVVLELLPSVVGIVLGLLLLRPLLRVVDHLTTTRVEISDRSVYDDVDGRDGDPDPWLAVPAHVRAAQRRVDAAWAAHVHRTEHACLADWETSFVQVLDEDGITHHGLRRCRTCGTRYLEAELEVDVVYEDPEATRRHLHAAERHEDRPGWAGPRLVLHNFTGKTVIDSQRCRYCGDDVRTFEKRLLDFASAAVRDPTRSESLIPITVDLGGIALSEGGSVAVQSWATGHGGSGGQAPSGGGPPDAVR